MKKTAKEHAIAMIANGEKYGLTARKKNKASVLKKGLESEKILLIVETS
ncbi:hypothetical protein [Sporosarcina sp. OR05]